MQHCPPAESVPWRLTRELVDALGPTGVEGVFTSSCEHTLRLLQTDAVGEALLTVLEAFVDDPLRGWKAGSGLDGVGCFRGKGVGAFMCVAVSGLLSG